MNVTLPPVDVLCIGHASYDLVFSVDHHPLADEKTVAQDFFGCGGGPAANAAVTVSRLGLKAAFAGYLGQDLYGDKHQQELTEHHVDTQLLVRGTSPTPLSTILVKPNGQRALINYRGDTQALPTQALDCHTLPFQPKVLLFDGHEPHVSAPLAQYARQQSIPTVLDAGSLHAGTRALMSQVDYLVCSEQFARQLCGDTVTALYQFSEIVPVVVITLGEKGLLWQRGQTHGKLPAFPVQAIDTTGAGDAFHGAFAAGLAMKLAWPMLLRYASAAGALCCTKMGARPGLPTHHQQQALLAET